MRRVASALLTAAVIGGLILVGLNATGVLRSPDRTHQPAIGVAIETWAAQARPGEELTLAQLAPFAWDRVVILPPYASNAEAAAAGVNGWDVERSPTFVSESGNLIGFIQGGVVIAWTVVGRQAELPPGQTGRPLELDRPDAVLEWSGSIFKPAT